MATRNELATLLLRPLRGLGDVGPELTTLLETAAIRLIDARMIVEDALIAPPEAPAARDPFARPMPALPETAAIDALLARVATDGLSTHFLPMVGLFGSILLTFLGDDEQRARVRGWTGTGLFGAFLMTDAGGPGLADWRSELTVDGDRRALKVDKIHAIAADRPGFALIAVRSGKGGMVPQMFLVSPEACEGLRRTKAGAPWLDGALQLGNVTGEALVGPNDLLKQGGLAGVNRFLTLVRPRFVRSLMAHLSWLEAQGRLAPSDRQRALRANIERLARAACEKPELTRDSVDEVLAVKLTSNELLLDLVATGAVPRTSDERDLLGFSRMEGSSYRCFYEIVQKKNARAAQ